MTTTTITTTNATTERTDALQGRLTVPWSTVLPLAVVLAYADGFWMTSLRGATGAIERTQEPFASWLRESTILLPVFVFAVLGALTLAQRRFGPVLRTPRRIVATALLVVAAGTVAGIAEMAASSAYDYHLQSSQLRLMESMHRTNAGSSLAQQQQATLGLQVHAVAYGAVILLVTNLVMVAWAVAIRGGRLKVSATRQPAAATLRQPRPRGVRLNRPVLQAAAANDIAHSSRVADLRLLLAAGLLGSAAIHAAVVPEHLTEWVATGAFFIVLVTAELAVVALLRAHPKPAVLLAATVVSIGPLALWLYSRILGMPFGPGAGVREQVGLADLAACALEIGTLLVAVVLLRGKAWLRRPTASTHVRWLTLVAVIAVTAIGLAGSGVAWFDASAGSADQMVTLSSQ